MSARVAERVRSGQRRRPALAAAAAVALAVLAGCASPGGSGTDPASGATPSAPSATTVLVFGDSIVEGCCTQDEDDPTMAEQAARELGWELTASHSGATGYVSPGPAELRRVPYGQRIAAEVRDTGYDVIVLQGGTNDVDVPASRLVPAVRDVTSTVRTLRPDAELVLLGPYAPPGYASAYTTVVQVLRDEAARIGVPFIDAVPWMQGHPELLAPDGFHPDSAGHAYLGHRLAEELRAATAR